MVCVDIPACYPTINDINDIQALLMLVDLAQFTQLLFQQKRHNVLYPHSLSYCEMSREIFGWFCSPHEPLGFSAAWPVESLGDEDEKSGSINHSVQQELQQ